jgi:hypothetical protein
MRVFVYFSPSSSGTGNLEFNVTFHFNGGEAVKTGHTDLEDYMIKLLNTSIIPHLKNMTVNGSLLDPLLSISVDECEYQTVRCT